MAPLLFALCIEPLAAAICMMTFLLTLTNPHVTLPNLHALLREFIILSGYRVNTLKTEANPINLWDDQVESLKA